jgi:hypothetical protein
MENNSKDGGSLLYPLPRQMARVLKNPRLFVAKASNKVVSGYPLESIQIDPETREYVSELSDEEQALFWATEHR